MIFFPLLALFLAFPSTLGVDPFTTLECHRRQYSYKIQQSDTRGHVCWDHVNVMSCWGRCDSNEIADWKFPYKRSHHPVCLHSSQQDREVILRNCDPEVEPETRYYRFQEAATCSCTFCKSSETSCEGLRYRGSRMVATKRSDKEFARRALVEVSNSTSEQIPSRELIPNHQNGFGLAKKDIETAVYVDEY